MGRLAALPRYTLINILKRLQARGIISGFDERSTTKILAETIADHADELGTDLDRWLSPRKRAAVDQKVLDRLTNIIIKEYSPKKVREDLDELLYYGILDQVPSGTSREMAQLLARAALEDLSLVSSRFPDMEELVSEAKQAPAVKTSNLNDAINYLMTLPLSSIRDALRMVSGPGSPYRPGRSKETAARALVANLAREEPSEMAMQSPIISAAYRILTGAQAFSSPTRLGTPVSRRAEAPVVSGVLPAPAPSPGRTYLPSFLNRASPAREASPPREASPVRSRREAIPPVSRRAVASTSIRAVTPSQRPAQGFLPMPI